MAWVTVLGPHLGPITYRIENAAGCGPAPKTS